MPAEHRRSQSTSSAAGLLGVALALTHTCSACLSYADEVYPQANWQVADPASVDMVAAHLKQARDYALTGGGSGMITRRGRLVMSWGDPDRRYDLKSTSKSIGVTALGLAVDDGRMKLDDFATKHHTQFGIPPKANAASGRSARVTIRHLATQTAGFAKRGGYEKLLFEPGKAWHYSDCGPNWLAECVTLAYGKDIQELLFDRVFTPIGIQSSDLRWRKHAYRNSDINGIPRREFGSGVHANVDAMARIGLLYLRHGRWRDRQIVSREFIDVVRRPVGADADLPEFPTSGNENGQWSSSYGNASAHYGLLWWNNADGTLQNVPTDAHWSWGLYDSLIVVIPSLDIVISRAGQSWKRKQGSKHYAVLQPFLEPIVKATMTDGSAEDSDNPCEETRSTDDKREQKPDVPPYPMSTFITSATWAPKQSTIRLANGSDNWPVTWADDGHLYTAYGDGWGFRPRTEKKLSLGLARIAGSPPAIMPNNIRSPTAEQVGQGANGQKASGMLCVNGRLFMLVRNARHSRLAWSDDHAATWQWADWRFETSFGCPTFVNFGRDYAGARDRFVYVVSPDSDSAYKPADRFVLARVLKNKIADRSAWQFFCGPDASQPMWTEAVSQRTGIFHHPASCYRGGVTFSNGLQRYLWCQVLPTSRDKRGPRFEGGFGIYESREPWGPWSTVYFTRHWDVGPGESCCLPAKWMSDDGRNLYLLFSGDDCFSVRELNLTVAGRDDR